MIKLYLSFLAFVVLLAGCTTEQHTHQTQHTQPVFDKSFGRSDSKTVLQDTQPETTSRTRIVKQQENQDAKPSRVAYKKDPTSGQQLQKNQSAEPKNEQTISSKVEVEVGQEVNAPNKTVAVKSKPQPKVMPHSLSNKAVMPDVEQKTAYNKSDDSAKITNEILRLRDIVEEAWPSGQGTEPPGKDRLSILEKQQNSILLNPKPKIRSNTNVLPAPLNPQTPLDPQAPLNPKVSLHTGYVEEKGVQVIDETRLPKLDSAQERHQAEQTENQVAVQSLQRSLGDPAKTRSFQVAPLADDKGAYHVVRVYYATDRNITGRSRPNKFFGTERSQKSYGAADVSIPKNHKVGHLEAPSIWRLEFSENPERHVTLLKIDRQDKSDFFSELKQKIDLSIGKNAFLFVHGYNVAFHEAAKRTAQIAYDLNFEGAAVFYSWPSKGRITDYSRDEATIEWTQHNLKNFVRDFALRSDAENIYLIAHSMGSRPLTRAVAELVVEMPALKKRFKEIMLAAPDIDADVFKRDIAPKLVQASRHVTLYAAADDKALQISKTLHGEPRAGDAGENLIVYNGIDTIDATGIDASFFRHNYFSDAPTVLSDINAIISSNLRPAERDRLKRIDTTQGAYWAFKKNGLIIVNGDASVTSTSVTEVAH